MKRLYYCILIFGLFYGGIKSASAESPLILSTSADIQVSATVISPVGFVFRESKKQAQLPGSTIEFTSSREISVMTNGNTLLEIENGQRKFYLISSENSGCFSFNNNLLWSNNAPLISFLSMTSVELQSKTTTDSRLCLVTLITISD